MQNSPFEVNLSSDIELPLQIYLKDYTIKYPTKTGKGTSKIFVIYSQFNMY